MVNRVFILLLLTSVAFSSCSVFKFAKIYSTSDNESGTLNGDVFTKGATKYRIGTLNNDWKRVNIDYGDLFFANKSKTAAITVNSTCENDKVEYSLSALAGSLLIGIKGKKLLRREEIFIDNQQALFSVYDAVVEKDRLTIATAVFVKGECVYDFSYSNISDSFDLYFNDFVGFLENFSVLDG